MKPLRILIACPAVENPYVLQLNKALNENDQIDAVHQDLTLFENPKPGFDIVHIQWPESLTSWREPTTEELSKIRSVLGQWRELGATIVVTVHNEAPHSGKSSQLYKALYDTIYACTSAFIHLGHESVRLFKERHVKERSLIGGNAGVNEALICRPIHQVIAHGNYDYFREVASHAVVRGIFPERSEFNVMAFGRIRHLAEVRLLSAAAKQLASMGGALAIAGRLPRRRMVSLGHFQYRMPLWLQSNVSLVERHIPDSDVAQFINAADALFIPRIDTLNSGNVPLGFTFGKVVIGPDIGVIGEELRKLGNPVYDPNDLQSLSNAIVSAKQLTHQGLGKINNTYSQDYLGWIRLAQEHVDAYRLSMSLQEA